MNFLILSITSLFIYFNQVASSDLELPQGVCLFNSSISVLKCNGSTLIECPIEVVNDTIKITTFSAFAIASKPDGDLKQVNSLKYALYPSKMGKNGWKHSKVRDQAKQIHKYALFAAKKFDDFKGFRIVDGVCWAKLVDFFSSVKKIETIKLGSSPNRVDDATIVAKIFINKLF